ncbi:MAG: 23S rRNA pseudouridine1911/1915/1917 synthase [Sphingobacteriales bacterium]|jgi:23S rRNA pseudouridine1911/1915/1917 synthase
MSNKSTPQNLEVLFEDNHLIAVNKKVGDITQGDKTGDMPLSEVVGLYLKNKYAKPGDAFVGVIHRIDRPVSGVVLFAKTSKALARMNLQFQDKEAKKRYHAIVFGTISPKQGTLEHYLIKDASKNKSRICNANTPNAKKAILHYNTIRVGDKYSLVQIALETGRHHQIRVQLSSLGEAIRGDLKYGAKRSNKDGGISLHSRTLAFTHPVTKEHVSIIAPYPSENLWGLLDACPPAF